jgi:23S rRNA C2498 (ribose-2'-O)-methylase RlmM
VSHRRTKQQVTFYLPVTLRKCQKVKIKRQQQQLFHALGQQQLPQQETLLMVTDSNGSSEIVQLCRKAEVGLPTSSILREVHHQETPKQERKKFYFVCFR